MHVKNFPGCLLLQIRNNVLAVFVILFGLSILTGKKHNKGVNIQMSIYLLRYSCTSLATLRPLAIARTTKLAPLIASPAANTLSRLVWC